MPSTTGSRIELRQLELFVAVADRRHFGEAARSSHIAQSALSQHIMRLERSIGVKLFERTSRRVELTPSGLALLVDARAILAASDRAVERARGAADPSGRRFVVVMCGFCQTEVGIRIVRDLRRGSAGNRTVARHLPITTAHDMWHRGEIDAVLTFVQFEMAQSPAVGSCVIREEPRTLVVPVDHPLAGQDEVRLGQLGGEALTGLPGCVTDLAADMWAPATTSQGRRIFHVGTAEFVEDVFAIVATGEALGVIPAWAQHSATGFDGVTTVAIRAEPARLFAFWRQEPDDQTASFAEYCSSFSGSTG